MARCIDYPACGHELGCCPDFDASGRQLNMICTCGAILPIDNRYSICDSCLQEMDEEEGNFDDADDEFEDNEPNEDMDGDFDSGMASAGFGTDEDYGYNGEDEWLDQSYENCDGYGGDGW